MDRIALAPLLISNLSLAQEYSIIPYPSTISSEQNEIMKSKNDDWLVLSIHLAEAGRIGILLLVAKDKDCITSRISILQWTILYKGY